jgi:cytoskeletal protein CcmA (bactofilin family)
VAEQEKKYKPLLEALVSKTDGLDILAEITGEERKAPGEKREAAAPTDTFSGMLQTLPMLIMLPAIMPLLQQTLSQTLSSTTVNVKVESATAIVPIDISASTAIVPIEIKASSVTLNVNISGSNVTLNVNITGSDVTFNVNVQGGTVNVTGTVSISGTVNVTGTVSISGTVNVSGTVSISGTVNVSGNVNINTVSGDVNIIIKSQTSDVQLTETYWTMRGYDKPLSRWDFVVPTGGVYYDYIIEYTVPQGKMLVVYAIDITLLMMKYYSSDEIASRYPTAGWYPTLYTYGDDVEVELRKGDDVLTTFECRPTSPHLRHEFKVPKIYNAGDVLRIWAHAKLGYSMLEATVYGVELAV